MPPKTKKTEQNLVVAKAEDAARPPATLPTRNIEGAKQLSAILPVDLEEAWTLSKYLSLSTLTPNLPGGPGSNTHVAAVFAIIQQGATVGLPPMSSLATFSLVNGRLAIYGDGMLALLHGHGAIETIDEHFENLPDDSVGLDDWPNEAKAVCTIKRKGMREAITAEFSVGDARRAGLWNKKGSSGRPTPWVTFPKRMLQMRARGFCCRDVAPDLLLGFQHTVEELTDLEPVDGGTAPSMPIERDYNDAPHEEETEKPEEVEPIVCIDWNGEAREWLSIDEALEDWAGIIALAPTIAALDAFIDDNNLSDLVKDVPKDDPALLRMYDAAKKSRRHLEEQEAEQNKTREEAERETMRKASDDEEEHGGSVLGVDHLSPASSSEDRARWHNVARDFVKRAETVKALDEFEKNHAPDIALLSGIHKTSLERLIKARGTAIKKERAKK